MSDTHDSSQPQPGRDFYTEQGSVVFTAAFLLRRGWCCGNGCRHCPYEDVGEPEAKAPGAKQDKPRTQRRGA